MAKLVQSIEPITVSPRRAAELSGLGVTTIRRHIASGTVEATKVGRRVVVNLESLRTLLRDGTPRQYTEPPAAVLPPRIPPPIPTRRPQPNWAALTRVP